MWGEKCLIQPEPIIIPQIETKNAIDNIKDIINFNFDYYLIGPYDLSLSLNTPGMFDNSQFKRYINEVNSKIPKENLAVHIPSDIKEQINKYEGYGIKCLGMDTVAILEFNKESKKYA